MVATDGSDKPTPSERMIVFMGAKVLKIDSTAKEGPLFLYLFEKRFGFLKEKVYLCSQLEFKASDFGLVAQLVRATDS